MNKKSRDIPSLTGLRGVAALIVVFYHANLSAVRDIDNYRDMIYFHGYMFVDLFFILSGFVISHVYLSSSNEKIDWKQFFLARFARIYPLHIASALLAAVGFYFISVLKSSGWPLELTLAQAIREFTLTQAMPFAGSDGIWNSPSWSISVEFWTYFLIFPMIVFFNSRVGWLVASISALAALTLLVVYLFIQTEPSTRGVPAFLRAAVSFYVGWATWRISQNLSIHSVRPWLVNLIAVAVIVLTQLGEHFDHSPWYSIIFMPFLLVGCANTNSITSRILESRLVVFLGVISFSVYMWHPLIIKLIQLAVRKLPGFEHSIPLFVVLAFCLTIPFAFLSYKFIEVPMRNFIRTLSSKR